MSVLIKLQKEIMHLRAQIDRLRYENAVLRSRLPEDARTVPSTPADSSVHTNGCGCDAADGFVCSIHF